MRLRTLLLPLALVVTTATLGASPASAQDASDLARAEALFNEGTKLLEAGKTAEACPKLADSQRLVRGIGVTLYLAECFERAGKTASAWAQFRLAESLAGARGDARASVAKERAQRLEGLVPTMQISVAAGADVPGLEVKRDGSVVARSEWGVAEPIDPGPHTVTAAAPQKAKWESTVTIAPEKALSRVEVPRLVDATVESVAPPAPPPTTPVVPAAPDASAPTQTPAADTGPAPGRTQRLIGLGVAGAGVVGIGIGSAFGLVALSHFQHSNSSPSLCDKTTDTCTSAGLQARTDGQNAATVSNVAFTVGAVALAGGLVLYFTAPRSAQPVAFAPSVGPRDAGLVLRGAW